jgi:tryptophan-rich sensory protein
MNTPDTPITRAAEPPPELRVIAFIGIIGATALTAALGGLISAGDADPWYQAQNHAPGSPPGVVFAVVWPTLYTLMAIGACRVWMASGWRKSDAAMGIFFLQLLANLGWSVLFFRFHLALAALIDVAALWVLVALMIKEFGRHDRIAAQLQYPYLAWLTFAFYLNAWVVFAN